MGLDDTTRATYRWHELMWRLDEMEELAANGLPEDEVGSFAGERASLLDELARLESSLDRDEVARLRHAHSRDRAYREQLRQMEEES